jgi:hypothetical protein
MLGAGVTWIGLLRDSLPVNVICWGKFIIIIIIITIFLFSFFALILYLFVPFPGLSCFLSAITAVSYRCEPVFPHFAFPSPFQRTFFLRDLLPELVLGFCCRTSFIHAVGENAILVCPIHAAYSAHIMLINLIALITFGEEC